MHDQPDDRGAPQQPARRRLLAASSGGLGALALAACSKPAAAVADQVTPTQAAGTKPTLTSQTTEGPYYFDAKKVRADITEGHDGIPLEIVFDVVDETGAVLPDVRVDVWHCNAQGLYSGYARQGDDGQADLSGQTFLRGTQTTDAAGRVVFNSIYPGWYRGRTTHIHFKVIRGDVHVLTCQFFLPDALSEFLYTQAPDYQRSVVRDQLNSTDGIALQAGPTAIGSVHEATDRYVARLAVAVDRNATPATDRPGQPGAGGPPGAREGERPPMPPPGRGGRGGPPMAEALEGDARLAALIPGSTP